MSVVRPNRLRAAVSMAASSASTWICLSMPLSFPTCSRTKLRLGSIGSLPLAASATRVLAALPGEGRLLVLVGGGGRALVGRRLLAGLDRLLELVDDVGA